MTTPLTFAASHIESGFGPLNRRKLLTGAAALAGSAVTMTAASAANWPDRAQESPTISATAMETIAAPAAPTPAR